MKTKTLLVVAILSVAAITKVHGFGFGLQFNFSTGGIFAPGAAVAFSPSDNTHLAFNWYLGSDKVNIVGLTFDVCPLNLPIVSFGVGSLNFTLGIGIYANIVITEYRNDRDVTGGLRLPVGFSLLLFRDIFEIYTHIAPSFGVVFVPSLGFTKPFFPIAVGARIWIR